MMTKEEYVLKRVKNLVMYHLDKQEIIKPDIMHELMEQWAFDYDMEKEYRPEILKK